MLKLFDIDKNVDADLLCPWPLFQRPRQFFHATSLNRLYIWHDANKQHLLNWIVNFWAQKKSKPTFSSISWPFPSSSESFLSDSLRFALAFEYLLITTFVIAFNHYVIINTICTQFCHHFSFLFMWLLGILCFCRSNISPACRAHGENTLSTCSVWTTTPNTSVEKLIAFFWKSNILSLKRSSAKKHRGASQKSDYFNGMRYTSTATPPCNNLIILGTWILQIQGFLKMISSSEPKDWVLNLFTFCFSRLMLIKFWDSFSWKQRFINTLHWELMKCAIRWRRLFVWSIINCWNFNLRW